MIFYNAIKCDGCREVIESTHRHDFKYCRCPEDSITRCAVDGGLSYIKRIGNGYWEELSIVIDTATLEKELAQIGKMMPHYNLYVPHGWWKLVVDCHKEMLRTDPAYTPIQIKQKFGGLRYYYVTNAGAEVNELLGEIVQKYEHLSWTICEKSSRKGARLYKIGGHYLTTLHPDYAPEDAVMVETTPQ